MTITTKSTKAEILAALKDAEARIATLEATQKNAVRLALEAAERHGLCVVVEKTIKKAGLGHYITTSYAVQVKRQDGHFTAYGSYRSLRRAKQAFADVWLDSPYPGGYVAARLLEVDPQTRKRTVLKTRERKPGRPAWNPPVAHEPASQYDGFPISA